MTREEAKLILQSVRADNLDAADSKARLALQYLERDPELAAWFAEEQAFDAAVRRKLEQVAVPENLLQRILRREASAGRQRSPRRRTALALAACLAALLGIAALWLSGNGGGDGEFAAFRADMARFVREFPRLDVSAEKWADIDRWLAGKASWNGTEIPAALRDYPGIGCRELRWRNKRVLLVCLAVRGEIVHLFLVPDGGPRASPRATEPQFARARGWSTAAWNSKDFSALILTKADEAFLRNLVRPRG